VALLGCDLIGAHRKSGSFVFVLLFCLNVTTPSVAQEQPTPDDPPEMTLAAAVGLALRNNRTIKTAQVAREAQNFAVRLQESLFDPQVSLTTEATTTKTRQKTYSTTSVSRSEVSALVNQLGYAASLSPTATLKTKSGTSYTLQWNNSFARTVDRTSSTSGRPQFTVDPELTIVQPLLKGFGQDVNTANLEISKLNTKLGHLSMRNTVAQVITAVVNAYWQVVLDKEQLEIARHALDRARQILEINRALVASGRMAELDTVQAEADVAQKEFSLDVADNTYQQAKINLLALLALPKFSDFTPSPIGDIEQIEIPLGIAFDLAESNRIEIAQAKISRSLAKVALVVAEDGKKWDLNLTGKAGSSNTRREIMDAIKGVPTDSNTLSIGVKLVIPFTSLAPEAEVVNAKGSLATAELSLAEIEQSVRVDTQNAVRDAVANYRQLQLAQKATALAERQLEVERDKLSIGRSSNFQVLSYQDTLRTAQLNEISARVGYLTALANLDLALGTTLDTWNVETTDEDARLTTEAPQSMQRLATPPGTPAGALPPPQDFPEVQ
jgi:outer membrane protein TolC